MCQPIYAGDTKTEFKYLVSACMQNSTFLQWLTYFFLYSEYKFWIPKMAEIHKAVVELQTGNLSVISDRDYWFGSCTLNKSVVIWGR